MRLSKLTAFVVGGLGVIASSDGSAAQPSKKAPAFLAGPVAYSTSTLYTTSYFTVTECALGVSECPTDAVTVVTSVAIALTTTTICLVTTTPPLPFIPIVTPTNASPGIPSASDTEGIPISDITATSSAPYSHVTSLSTPSLDVPGSSSASSFDVQPTTSFGKSSNTGRSQSLTPNPVFPASTSSRVSYPISEVSLSVSFSTISGSLSVDHPIVVTPVPSNYSPSIPLPVVGTPVSSNGSPTVEWPWFHTPVPSSVATSVSLSPNETPSPSNGSPTVGWPWINTPIPSKGAPGLSLPLSETPAPSIGSPASSASYNPWNPAQSATQSAGIPISSTSGSPSFPSSGPSSSRTDGTPHIPQGPRPSGSAWNPAHPGDSSATEATNASPVPSFPVETTYNPGQASPSTSGESQETGTEETRFSSAPSTKAQPTTYPPATPSGSGFSPIADTTTSQVTNLITFPLTTIVTVPTGSDNHSTETNGFPTSHGTGISGSLPSGSGWWPIATENGTINSPSPTLPLPINNEGHQAFSGKSSLVAVIAAFVIAHLV